MFTTAARDVMEVMRWKKPFHMEWKLTEAQTRTDLISTSAGAAFGFKASPNPGVVALTPGWLRCHLRLPFTVDKERERSRATGCLVQRRLRRRLHRLSWASRGEALAAPVTLHSRSLTCVDKPSVVTEWLGRSQSSSWRGEGKDRWNRLFRFSCLVLNGAVWWWCG